MKDCCLTRRALPSFSYQRVAQRDPFPNFDVRKCSGSAFALLNRANARGECWPSLATLTKEVGVSNRTIMRKLEALEDKGLIRKTRRAKDSLGQISNLYKVLAFQDAHPRDILSPPGDNERVPPGAICHPLVTTSTTKYYPVKYYPLEVLVTKSGGRNGVRLGALRGEVIQPEDVPDGTTKAQAIPTEFLLTDAMKAWAAENAPGVNLQAATRDFVTYWRFGDGRGKRKKNWVLTWRNHMKKQHSWLPVAERQPRKAKRFNDDLTS